MKINKYSIITISIVVPLIITVLIGMYSYGAIGDWTKNQEKFVDYVFDQKDTSASIIEEFVKFNSSSYSQLDQNVELFKNYAVNSETINPSNGVFEFDNFKMEGFALLGDSINKKYSYNFYFYDIDNTEIDFSKIAFVLFESTDVNDTHFLAAEIDKYKNEFLTWNKSSSNSTMSIYAENLNKVSKNMFFTSGELLEDVDGTAKYVDGIAANRLLYFADPKSPFNSSKSLSALGNCQFAIFSLGYDSKGNPESCEIITTGKITNIAASAEEHAASAKNIKKGYTLGTLTALENAGYKDFIWKTVLTHSLITLVISGFLGFMFYKTWNLDLKSIENNNKNKKYISKKSK